MRPPPAPARACAMLSDCWAVEVVATAEEEEDDCWSRSPSVGEGAVVFN